MTGLMVLAFDIIRRLRGFALDFEQNGMVATMPPPSGYKCLRPSGCGRRLLDRMVEPFVSSPQSRQTFRTSAGADSVPH